MIQILNPDTVERVFAADPEAITRTIREGGWNGMPVPGDPDWDLTPEGMPCDRLISLGLHYFTARHPGADQTLICVAAQLIHEGCTGWVGGYPVDERPEWERPHAWLLAFAGGQPAPPGEIMALSPPIEEQASHGYMIARVPGDRAAFTEAAIRMVDAIVFGSEDDARRIIDEYLVQVGDPLAARAAEIFEYVSRLDYGRDHDAPPAPRKCFDCGTGGLDHYYTSRKLGYDLCTVCFDARQKRGLAREAE